MRLVSVVIPAYNEEKTIEQLIAAVEAVDLGKEIQKELIIINDGSTDSTREILRQYEARHRVIHFPRNRGKGTALREGFLHVRGDIIITQDADLEYDPKDYPKLIGPIQEGRADVVYGSRFSAHAGRAATSFWHYLGNRVVTLFSNFLTDLHLTDITAGTKAFSRAALSRILGRLTSERFEIESEMTAEVARARFRIYEVPISYTGRTVAEGKKIKWRDGFSALWCIMKANLLR